MTATPTTPPRASSWSFSHWSRIYIANADGSHRTNVMAGYNPDWQPVA